MSRLAASLAVILAAACGHPQVAGTSLLNVQPGTRPPMVGAYDFELLEPVTGEACLEEFSALSNSGIEGVVWIDGPPNVRSGLAQSVIAAATYNAVQKLGTDADTLLVTLATFAPKGKTSTLCATVHGRGVRVFKAEAGAGTRRDAPAGSDTDEKPGDIEE